MKEYIPMLRFSSLILLVVCQLAFVRGFSADIGLTPAQLQQIMSVAQQIGPNAPTASVTLTMGDQQIVYTITKNAVGAITARAPTGTTGIKQITFVTTRQPNGTISARNVIILDSNNQIKTAELAVSNNEITGVGSTVVLATNVEQGGASGAGGSNAAASNVGNYAVTNTAGSFQFSIPYSPGAGLGDVSVSTK
jgi:hypothetical protein